MIRLAIVSDVHFASAAEKQRRGHEFRAIDNPFLRAATRAYRHVFWLRDPFAHNHLLDRCLDRAGTPDLFIGLGDYSCDTAFVGVSDDAALASARECLHRLRSRFGDRLCALLGDHELGKLSLFGGKGGLRLESWRRSVGELSLTPFLHREAGGCALIGVMSSLVALPVLEPETLQPERADWWRLREEHLEVIRKAFAGLRPDQRVILFCHDPTALPFLAREPAVRGRLGQIDMTVIGHLHSQVILANSRILSGMPRIGFLGNTVRRLSSALRSAREWKPFRIRLCPSLSGTQLLKDGGFARIEIDAAGHHPPRFTVEKLRWNDSQPDAG